MSISNGYATLTDVKAALRISDAVDDSLIELSIEAASREIDGYCQRVFYNAGSATRYYVPDNAFVCQTDDFVSLTSVQTSSDGVTFETTWATSDYQAEPLNNVVGGIAWPRTQLRAAGALLFPSWRTNTASAGIATVKLTGTFGWSAVPVQVKQACILLAMRQFKRYDSPLGVAGFSDLGVVRVGRVDPDVEALLMPFKKVSVA